jgi:hypothetical protein
MSKLSDVVSIFCTLKGNYVVVSGQVSLALPLYSQYIQISLINVSASWQLSVFSHGTSNKQSERQKD